MRYRKIQMTYEKKIWIFTYEKEVEELQDSELQVRREVTIEQIKETSKGKN